MAAFYLAHRLSKDLDLFTIEEFDPLELQKLIEQIAKETSSTFITKVKTQSYNDIYFENHLKSSKDLAQNIVLGSAKLDRDLGH